MEVIDFKDYRFLKVCESPNIMISLNGTKQFCDLNKDDKYDLLHQAFGVSAFNEFIQIHGTSIFNLDLNIETYDGYIEIDHFYIVTTRAPLERLPCRPHALGGRPWYRRRAHPHQSSQFFRTFASRAPSHTIIIETDYHDTTA